MDTYNAFAQLMSRLMTDRYSTSFSLASRLFSSEFRQHIYNIYGLVRTADEIVDSYQGPHAETILQELRQDTIQTLKRNYSPNPIVQAFCLTARKYNIEDSLISPFFYSMQLDLGNTYKSENYEEYIYGSAEVVGLMCLKVFCEGNEELYRRLKPGAQALGAAFQKVNFLRDVGDDHKLLGRYYFPVGTFATFDDTIKIRVVEDIRKDFSKAADAIGQLPPGSKLPIKVAYSYYTTLLDKLEKTPASTIKKQRIRIPNVKKYLLLFQVVIKHKIGSKHL